MKVNNYMAILRNLRNIIEAGVSPEHMEKVWKAIENPEAVKRSKQLPFRFLSAYNQIHGIAGSRALDALEAAVEAATDNLPKLPGKTVIAIDTSGSMSSNVSEKSEVTCGQVGMMLGLIANRICEDSLTYTFDIELNTMPVSRRSGILYSALNSRQPGWGTDMDLPLKKMISERIKADRLIVVSDNECNRGSRTVQRLADEYRRKVNPDLWVHAIDLQGYGTTQFVGPKTNIIAGWSEKVFNFILLAEQGEGALEKAIEAYKW